MTDYEGSRRSLGTGVRSFLKRNPDRWRRTPIEQEIKSEQDKLAFGKPTAELEWDGIRKLDMPPPKWWVYVFWATIFWAVAWWILYPAWPSLRGHTDGILGYDQREVVAGQLAATADHRQQFAARIEAAGLDEIYTDPQCSSTP